MHKNHTKIHLHFAIIMVILFLLIPVVRASTPAQVASDYTEPQERYELNKFTAWGKYYWIVTIDGVETLMLDENSNVVLDSDIISAVLIQNLMETSGVDEKTERIRALIRSFNESQYPERKVCERITGVDAMPCDDKESCIKACYRVPLCAMQIRDDLIYSIMSWNAERKAVDKAIIAATEKAKNPKTESDYRELCKLIQNMSDSMRIIDNNKLYDYPYCEEMRPTYNDAQLAKETCEEIANVLAAIPKTKERAEKIKTRTTERIRYLESREKIYSESYGAVYDLYSALKQMYKNAGWQDNKTEEKLLLAENYTTELSTLKKEGKYNIAIKLAEQYKKVLSDMKADMLMTNAQYDLMKSKAKSTMENISNAKKKLNGTKYEQNLTAYSEEIQAIFEKKVEKSKIPVLIQRIDEIDNSVKMMVAEAVLYGDHNKSEEESYTKAEGGENIVCVIIKYISSIVGFSIDFLRLCV